jgi:hypothetical protein
MPGLGLEFSRSPPHWAANHFDSKGCTIMGNKDRRKEKKKLKQPKAAVKPVKPGAIITTRPAK